LLKVFRNTSGSISTIAGADVLLAKKNLSNYQLSLTSLIATRTCKQKVLEDLGKNAKVALQIRETGLQVRSGWQQRL
jgi:hypothetical protein